MQPPKCTPPPGFKKLIRTIWSLIRPDRVLNFWGVHLGGTCLTPNIGTMDERVPYEPPGRQDINPKP